ncbi:MAG: M15 family metallopeptidase [Succinatimonas sp.]|nr:M15 family metallopeptidase [Succinatimonas sp.]MDD6376285.1 M15 family metallopeptidase [Succinatimonas sp.]
MATKEQLIGLDDSKLVNIKDDPRRMSVLMCDREAAKALPDLFSDAFDKGFELRIASAYRSFYKQFKIFDDKFKGKRPVLDENENPMDISSLSDEQKVLEIIRFSAIPGFSRHHFGTDFDIYAVNLLPEGKQLELTAREYQKGNYFYKLGQYLSQNLNKFGFKRPFNGKGTIAYEPWHISFSKKADECIDAFPVDFALEYLSSFNEPWVKYAVSYAKEHYKELLAK